MFITHSLHLIGTYTTCSYLHRAEQLIPFASFGAARVLHAERQQGRWNQPSARQQGPSPAAATLPRTCPHPGSRTAARPGPALLAPGVTALTCPPERSRARFNAVNEKAQLMLWAEARPAAAKLIPGAPNSRPHRPPP